MNPDNRASRIVESPRAQLAALTILPVAEIGAPASPQRPLGALSDFVCERIGGINDAIREGDLLPDNLWEEVESVFAGLPSSLINNCVQQFDARERRIALLDLVWIERSLNIAFDSSDGYRAARDASAWFATAVELARVERRHPVLSWSEIAMYHPVDDPRSFLAKGEDRDQEILMYRIQGGMERIFERMLASAAAGELDSDPVEWLKEVVIDLDTVLRAMIHLTRVRRVGQFYKLDPFLGANGEHVGHGTGAFSIWTFLVGVLLTGHENYAARIRDDRNHMAFDRDADGYVGQVLRDEFVTLPEMIEAAGLPAPIAEEAAIVLAQAQKKFKQFLMSHRGAMKRHSSASFADEAPSMPPLTNGEAIDTAIDDAEDSAD